MEEKINKGLGLSIPRIAPGVDIQEEKRYHRSMALYLIVIFAAFFGFLIAFYIHHTKRTQGVLVCPVGSDCNTVIGSDYARFLGIPVEILGMLYYATIAVNYAFFLALPARATPSVVFGVLILTTAAFLFSLYLTFIQAFALRQWCTWCLMSATLCTLIFAAALAGAEFGFVELLVQNQPALSLIHVLALTLGVGGATFTDLFFFKFLKDLRISEYEAEVLHTFSQVIWLALAVAILTGVGLYLPAASALEHSATFVAKLVALTVIIINGAFLNLLVAPRLVKISFGEAHPHESGELRAARRLALALGAISLVSWYAVFLLSIFSRATQSLTGLLGLYAVALLVTVAASQLLEHSFRRRRPA